MSVAPIEAAGHHNHDGTAQKLLVARRLEAARVEREAIALDAAERRMYGEAAMGLIVSPRTDRPIEVWHSWLRDTAWNLLTSNQILACCQRLGISPSAIMHNGHDPKKTTPAQEDDATNPKPTATAADPPDPQTVTVKAANTRPNTRAKTTKARRVSIERKGSMPRKPQEGEAKSKKALLRNVEEAKTEKGITLLVIGRAISPDAARPQSAWVSFKKSGTLPSIETIQRMASALGVVTDSLLVDVDQSLLPEKEWRSNGGGRGHLAGVSTKNRGGKRGASSVQARRETARAAEVHVAETEGPAVRQLVIADLREELEQVGNPGTLSEEAVECIAKLALALRKDRQGG
ncbi:MAG: hypothetical protein PHV78_00990 [Patescibacteria group bacterium]|nr:hypothetical protein [Patescibacteria group bacterium]MDD5121258.1 hypothetical protein [Patescibacteria group bacterium]MDD5222164.1 hypothetical protein [Patescibacteria group bacterium]MDD5395823.1 hypothetical protein [Patescibacteria group bacterium]